MTTDEASALGQFLKLYQVLSRSGAGYTDVAIAKMFGIDKSTVSRSKTKSEPPQLDDAMGRLRLHLGVPTEVRLEKLAEYVLQNKLLNRLSKEPVPRRTARNGGHETHARAEETNTRPHVLKGSPAPSAIRFSSSAFSSPGIDQVGSSARSAKYHVPDPDETFPMYRIGGYTLPVLSKSAAPSEPLGIGDVKIDYSPTMFEEGQGYPEVLKEVFLDVGKGCSSDTDDPDGTQSHLARLSGYKVSGMRSGDRRGKVTLFLQKTSWNAYQRTNMCLDRPLISDQEHGPTLRTQFVSFPYSFENAALANPLSTHLVLISRNSGQTPRDQIIIRRRSKAVALYPHFFQASAAGYVSIDHIDENGIPNPFASAIGYEGEQEIAVSLTSRVSPSDFKMIGLAIYWDSLAPNVYGYAETDLLADQLVGDMRRDDEEAELLLSLPFDPITVLSHIAENKWEPMGLLAVCATLLAHFDKKLVFREAERLLPKKHWREFLDT